MKNSILISTVFAMGLAGGCTTEETSEAYANIGQFTDDYCEATYSAWAACGELDPAAADSVIAECRQTFDNFPITTNAFPYQGVTGVDARNCVEAAAAQSCESIAADEGEPAACTAVLELFDN